MFKHRGKIKEILTNGEYYAILFTRRHSFYNKALNKKDSKTYDFIIGVYGRNAQKLKEGKIVLGQSVVVTFRVESFKPDIEKRQYKTFHSVICEDLVDLQEYKDAHKNEVSDELFDALRSDDQKMDVSKEFD